MPDTAFEQVLAIEPGDPPTLSVYFDMRPQETGENPGLRHSLIELKDRLRAIEKSFWPRGPAFDAFQTDAARIEDYLTHEFSIETHGLAIFACADRDLFTTLEVRAPFETQVSVLPAPDLFQLARLLDDQETTVVVVVDTNTARLFVTRYGHLDEGGGPNDTNAKHFRKRAMGGWSQARYLRRIDNFRAGFAREAAAALEQLVDEEGAVRVILAGDEVAVPLLQAALSQRVSELLYPEVLRLDIRTPSDAISAQVAPLLEQAEHEDDHALVDRLIGAVRAGGLGVIGLDESRAALEHGQAETLVLDLALELDDEQRSELIRLAGATSANVEVVSGHEGFAHMGGVGAVLRYSY